MMAFSVALGAVVITLALGYAAALAMASIGPNIQRLRRSRH